MTSALHPRTDISSALSLPLLVGNQLVGVLNLNILYPHRPFTLGQIKALQILTTTAAAALKSASLYVETKRAQEFNASIVASIAEGLVLLDLEGRLRLTNPQAQSLLGYLTEEPLAQHWSQIVPLGEQPFFAMELARQPEGAPAAFETRLLTKTNQEIPILASATPFIQDGQVVGTLVMFSDITKHKRAEEDLHESQEQLQGIIDSAMDAIITVDEAQTIRLFNPASTQMFGYPAKTMLGQPLDRLIPERLRVAHREHVQHFGQTGVTMRAMGALVLLC